MPEAAMMPRAPAISATRAARQNWTILALAVAADAMLLWWASHASSAIMAIAAALLFAFTNNSVFGLLHEAVHGKFDLAPRRNRLAGSIAAAFFPTSLTLQRSAHLTHHRNNRSELERFDYVGPGDSIPLKTAQWFSILTGFYWLGIPVFLAFYVLFADLVPWRRLVRPGRFSQQTSAGEFLESLMRLPLWRVRAEFAFSVGVQMALAWALGVSWGGWALCYGAFALAWSSLQYADHAFSRLDRVEGTWNLKVGGFTRRLFLNYHCHLDHHRDVDCRWQDLPGRARDDEPPRRFLAILLLMWQGPRLLPGSGQGAARQRLLDRSVVAAHVLVFAVAFELIYGLASLDFATRTDLANVALPIDAYAPFEPIWGLVYITVAPLLLVTALVLRRPDRTLPFLGALIVELVVGGLCFILYPVVPPQPPQVAGGTFAGTVFAMADTINLAGNCFPSLHVALAVSCAWAAAGMLRTAGRTAIWGWALAITVSTWLTGQHWLIDIVAGAVLAALGMGLVRPWLARMRASIEDEVMGPSTAPAGKN